MSLHPNPVYLNLARAAWEWATNGGKGSGGGVSTMNPGKDWPRGCAHAPGPDLSIQSVLGAGIPAAAEKDTSPNLTLELHALPSSCLDG